MFFGHFYSKAGFIMQGFGLLLSAWMHGAKTYNQHYEHSYKMKVYRGLDFSVREPRKTRI